MKPLKHFYWLDWMRFIAAFMVVVCHARGYHWVDFGSLPKSEQTFPIKVFFALTRAGLEWVVVFFVLSGFLVGGGVIRRTLDRSFDFSSFAIDRVSRIWVPLIPALILTLVVALICGYPVSFAELIGNVFALQGIFFQNFAHNMPLWSLSYEVWFYIIIGAVGILLQPGIKSKTAAFFMLAVGAVVFTKLSFSYLSCWLLGAFCLFLVSDKFKPAVLISGVTLAVLGSVISQLRSETISFTAASLVAFIPSREIAVLIESAGIGLLTAAICKVEPKGTLLVYMEKFGTKLAAFSYTLYLTHYPILDLWIYFSPTRNPSITAFSFLIFVSKVFSCLLAAWLLYLPFEAKTVSVRAWMRNFGSRRQLMADV